MLLSAPIYHLKRRARLLSRSDGIPLHAALDRLAAAEGFVSWSQLAKRVASYDPAAAVYAELAPGDLVLVGARPGQGKTLLSLELAIQAMKAGNHATFFSLEYTVADILDRFRAIGVDPSAFGRLFTFDDSDAISAHHIMRATADAAAGALAVVDYLQLLDQRRDNPDLASQVILLKAIARERAMILVVVAQIDRSYDPAAKPFPDRRDIRLPNPVDLSLFNKTCFLNAGEIRFEG